MKEEKTTEGRSADTRTFRQVTLAMDQDRINDQAVTFGQFRDWEAGKWEEQGDAPVVREEKEPLWMRMLSHLGLVLLVVGLVVYLYTTLRDFESRYSIGDWPKDMTFGAVVLVIGIILSLAVRGIAAYQERQRWLRVVRQQEEEKRKQ